MLSKKGQSPSAQESFLPKPDTTDKVIAGTQMAAGALGTFGALAPVPFIKEAADAAIYVAQIVKDVKNNQEEFKFIAQDAHHFVDKINQTCLRLQEEEGKIPGDLILDLKDFVDTLNKIKAFADANTHRRTFTRLFYKNLDPENIRRCREELQNRFQTFSIQSSIQARVDLAAVRSNTTKILANLEEHRGGATSDSSLVDSGGPSMLSPPPMSPTRQRPTSAPPTRNQFSALPSPSSPGTSDDPFGYTRQPGFPFNSPSQRQSQPVFNVTTNSNFNVGAGSQVYKSGMVNNYYQVGENDHSTNVRNNTYDGRNMMGGKMDKMNRKMERQFGPSRRRMDEDSSDDDQRGYRSNGRRGSAW